MMRSSSYAVFKIEFTAELTPLSEHALKPKYYVKVNSQSTQSCIHSLVKITHFEQKTTLMHFGSDCEHCYFEPKITSKQTCL